MPLIYDHPRQPPGGPYFVDPSGHTIRNESLEGLIKEIARYRTINGLPAGNPEKEVEQFYAVKFPWLITNVGTTPVATEDPVARWLNRAWRSPIKDWAEAETVEARASTCEACKHYAPMHRFDSDSMRRLMVLGAGRLRPMGACKAHLWACGLAILPYKQEAALHVDGCWVT